LPREQIVKAQTLGASSWQIMIRVALPQAMPRLIHAMRLALGPAWVFLISAEAIASDVGLGYRIFLVRRYLSMDIIIPYVAWIALLAILMDVTLTVLSRRLSHGRMERAIERAPQPSQRLGRIWRQDRARAVNLDIEAGSFVSIIGPSGAGKSSLLRVILGQEAADARAHPARRQPLAPECGPDRGVVFQRYSVFPHLSALRNTVFGLECAQAPSRRGCSAARAARRSEEAIAMLEAVGLGDSLHLYPAQMSGGMQQRLAIAQALIKRPRILLLDEPFGALDPGIRADMHALITKLWLDYALTIIMVTTTSARPFTLGTRVLALDKRRHDPHAPNRFGATAVYDLPLRNRAAHAEEIESITIDTIGNN
jgi:NitT/TauT family transport system ATP-binding protein